MAEAVVHTPVVVVDMPVVLWLPIRAGEAAHPEIAAPEPEANMAQATAGTQVRVIRLVGLVAVPVR